MQDENYDPDAAAFFFANMKAMLGDGAEEKPSYVKSGHSKFA